MILYLMGNNLCINTLVFVYDYLQIYPSKRSLTYILKMRLVFAFALLLATIPTMVSCKEGNSCSNTGDSNTGARCICLNKSKCKGQKVVKWANGKYPCPDDNDDIIGCLAIPCYGDGGVCMWKSNCDAEKRKEIKGKCEPSFFLVPLADLNQGNLCPGGDRFICCRYLD